MDWIEKRGFGDRPLDGDATHVDEAAERRLRMTPEEAERLEEKRQRLQRFMAFPEPERAEDSGPMWNALGAATLTAGALTLWFSLLALCGSGHWTVAEVTAPLWGTALAGGVVALVAGVVCMVLDAWASHQRRGRRA